MEEKNNQLHSLTQEISTTEKLGDDLQKGMQLQKERTRNTQQRQSLQTQLKEGETRLQTTTRNYQEALATFHKFQTHYNTQQEKLKHARDIEVQQTQTQEQLQALQNQTTLKDKQLKQTTNDLLSNSESLQKVQQELANTQQFLERNTQDKQLSLELEVGKQHANNFHQAKEQLQKVQQQHKESVQQQKNASDELAKLKQHATKLEQDLEKKKGGG